MSGREWIQFIVGGVLSGVGLAVGSHGAIADVADDGWQTLEVPGAWQTMEPDGLGDYTGYAWYRCWVEVPEGWARRWELTLSIEHLADAYEVYFNGESVVQVGGFPPDYADASQEALRHTIPRDLVRRGERNFLALRVYSEEAPSGFLGGAPALMDYHNEIILKGPWQFRVGDDLSWASVPEPLPEGLPVYDEVVEGTQVRTPPTAYEPGQTLSPEASHQAVETVDDLAVDLVRAEPDIKQPVHMSFDEQGRLWVVEYRQYPYPAGLRMVSRDIYWRAVWEPDLPPPPYEADSPFRGRDRITVHEDTTGDGAYDSMEVFVDGLNITTAVAHDDDGVWVLSPPHLLFYPVDASGTAPAGPPEVHLEGFGLEDTHSVANSLTWGPDGWLYAAQGSTVTAAIRRPGEDGEPTRSIGQNIWRYHPETGRYEIFAEGGGNAFGVEIDAQGRVFSGHNGGNTRGFHYVQGGYYQKNFGKHGPHTNPYTFGHFPAMEHGQVPRFTHTFVIYEGDELPERYHGNLLGVEPLQGRIVHSEISPHGSTFQTRDLERPVTSTDPAFRPVDIKLAPDGSVYVADFYTESVAHGENYEGYLNREAGRIYRLRHQEHAPGDLHRRVKALDLTERSAEQLIGLLEHDNRWVRRTALRLLGDRADESVVPRLRRLLEEQVGQSALEALWALNLCGDLDEHAGVGLDHASPHVRRWTVRLLGDCGHVSDEQAERLVQLAGEEPDVEVRSQLAATAKRLSASNGLAILRGLVTHDEDVDDPHLPLLTWWAMEAHCRPGTRDQVIGWFESPPIWDRPMVTRHLLTRVMRRLAATGRRSDLMAAAELLRLAPDRERGLRLIEGLEAAFENRRFADLPQPLMEAMAEAGVGSRILQVRQGDPEAIDEALKILGDPEADRERRLDYARLLGEVKLPKGVPTLLEVAAEADSNELREAVLGALSSYNHERIGKRVVELYESLPDSVRPAAQTLLAGRAGWSRQWLEAIDSGRLDAADVRPEIVEALQLHNDEAIQRLLRKHFPETGASDGGDDLPSEIRRMQRMIRQGDAGDPYAGRSIYQARCAACHRMFDEGGELGPDLTSYQRDLSSLVRSVVDPNADIRDGYEGVIVTTDDGRTLTGLLADADDEALVVRRLDGQETTVYRDRIAERRPMRQSLMPENLLTGLSDQEIRDLFAFLRSTQPINR